MSGKGFESIDQQPGRAARQPNGQFEPSPRPGRGGKTKPEDAKRLAPYAWKPGQTGNPAGAPERKGEPLREVRRLARERSPRAVERMTELMEGDDPRVAVVAAQGILTWAFGRPENLPAEAGAARATIDLSKLTPAELRTLVKLADSGRLGAAPESSEPPPVIDGTAESGPQSHDGTQLPADGGDG